MTTLDTTARATTTTTVDRSSWRAVCRADQLPVDRGVAALLTEGQIAIVRVDDGSLYAVGHRDPYSGANVIARGIIGSTIIDGVPVPTIASPMYKQVFTLRDGACVGEPSVSIGSWAVRERDGTIEIGQCLIAPTSQFEPPERVESPERVDE